MKQTMPEIQAAGGILHVPTPISQTPVVALKFMCGSGAAAFHAWICERRRCARRSSRQLRACWPVGPPIRYGFASATRVGLWRFQ